MSDGIKMHHQMKLTRRKEFGKNEKQTKINKKVISYKLVLLLISP